MNAKLTRRDHGILAKCAICRWLTTTQLRRLYFPKASLNAVQKRLRKLTDAGYLRSHRENQMAEAVYAVGAKGKQVVEERGLETATPEVSKQLEHLTGINSIRVTFETSGLPLAYFFAHWELGTIGWTFPVIPDAVLAIGVPLQQHFLIEYDRGTEPLKTIVEKVRAYNQSIAGFAADAVLLIIEENRRLDHLGRELRRAGIPLPCLAASRAEFEQAPTDAIFVELADGRRRPLVT
jgi:hypothetical protein